MIVNTDLVYRGRQARYNLDRPGTLNHDLFFVDVHVIDIFVCFLLFFSFFLFFLFFAVVLGLEEDNDVDAGISSVLSSQAPSAQVESEDRNEELSEAGTRQGQRVETCRALQAQRCQNH